MAISSVGVTHGGDDVPTRMRHSSKPLAPSLPAKYSAPSNRVKRVSSMESPAGLMSEPSLFRMTLVPVDVPLVTHGCCQGLPPGVTKKRAFGKAIGPSKAEFALPGATSATRRALNALVVRISNPADGSFAPNSNSPRKGIRLRKVD